MSAIRTMTDRSEYLDPTLTVPKKEDQRWICLICLSTRKGWHHKLFDGKAWCPNDKLRHQTRGRFEDGAR